MKITKTELNRLVEEVVTKKLNEDGCHTISDSKGGKYKEFSITLFNIDIYISFVSTGLELHSGHYLDKWWATSIANDVAKAFKEKYHISLGEPDINDAQGYSSFATFRRAGDVMSELVYNSLK